MLFRLSDIHKSYGGQPVLRGASFQVNVDEKIGLVGRNGAGKTTVFRVVTGEEAPDSGDVIKINGLKVGLLDQHVDFDDADSVHTAALSAFKRIHDIEAEMRRLEERMSTDHSEEVMGRYAELQHEFEMADGFTYAARAEAILLGLGFPKDTWDMPARNLSGGQKNRLGMARLLLSDSDVLLLDEPTNHLDVEAVEWLEKFLQNYPKTFVIISHDRYFLDRTVSRIVEIENGKAVSYKGNYSKFIVEREERREIQRREYENQQALIAKTEEFIRRNIEGQKTKQAKSRRNMLQRMDRVEAVSSDKPSGNFKLTGVERAGQNVLMTEDLAVGYDGEALAKGINVLLLRGECLGVIGGNGTGKTTFLKTLLGEAREVSGKYIWGPKTDIGYYSQQLTDLDARNEIIQELRRVAPSAENGELRSFLARFLFVGEDVFKRVGDLSGGEKGRLALAKLIFSRKNVLVLDEPTNHLDIPSREALEDALGEYPGTIITVSHDRFFLDKVATSILSFEQLGVTLFHDGDYTDFHDWKEKQDGALKATASAEEKMVGSVPAESKKENASNLSKNQRQMLERRAKEIEESLPAHEEALAKFSAEMAEPGVAADADALAELSKKYQAKENEIQAMYAEWEKILAELG